VLPRQSLPTIALPLNSSGGFLTEAFTPAFLMAGEVMMVAPRTRDARVIGLGTISTSPAFPNILPPTVPGAMRALGMIMISAATSPTRRVLTMNPLIAGVITQMIAVVVNAAPFASTLTRNTRSIGNRHRAAVAGMMRVGLGDFLLSALGCIRCILVHSSPRLLSRPFLLVSALEMTGQWLPFHSLRYGSCRVGF